MQILAGLWRVFLEKMNMQSLEAKLVENGAETVEDLAYVNEEMLVDMGVPAIKRKKFLKTVQNFLGN